MDKISKAGWNDLKFVDFGDRPDGRQVARAQNFIVEWVRAEQGASYDFSSDHETILIFPEVGGRLVGSAAADIPARAVAIVPRGSHSLAVERDGPVVILASQRSDLPAADFEPDPRIRPVGRPFAPQSSEVRVFELDRVPHPAGNPRLKFLQSETLSINFVEYTGRRERSALSPHSHKDFEQGSLTVTGEFLHHLRAEWGSNADHWRDDQHAPASGQTLMVIPPNVIHTTEGVGADRHMLFDIFAPPRQDFIEKGWVFNSREYSPMEITQAV